MHATRLFRCYGKELYGSNSTLTSDFFSACAGHFQIKLLRPTFIGVRTSQVRGIFASRTDEPIEANQTVAVIPLANLITASNVTSKPSTLRDVTIEKVRDAITDEEFRMMAPQFFMGLQIASIITQLPDVTSASSAEEVATMSDVLKSGLNPWARMLDDEDFNEQFVFGMYGMSLDSWQRESYQEMTKKFHLCLTSIHEAVRPPFTVDHFRRITRLVLARAELLPPSDYYDGPVWRRRWERRLRRLRGIKDPSELTLVPFLDLINHSNRPNCSIRIGPSKHLENNAPAISLVTLTRIESGQELCRHYNFALTRPAALFRYGFLPFDLISIVDHDAIDEFLVKNRDMISPVSDEKMREQQAQMDEIDRLENIYKTARRTKK